MATFGPTDKFLEAEFLRLKRLHEGTIFLFVEDQIVKIIQSDAFVVSHELKLPKGDIILDTSGGTKIAKFDVASLPVHLNALVARGHLVGIVRKLESWRDMTEPPGASPKREVTLFSRATLIGADSTANNNLPTMREVYCCRSWIDYLLVICEVGESAETALEDIALLAVCLTSGEAIFHRIPGSNIIDVRQSMLRELVMQIKPVEIILAKESLATRETVEALVATSAKAEERIKITRLDIRTFNSIHLKRLLREECGQMNIDFNRIFPGKPAGIRFCLQATLAHLLSFKLTAVVRLIVQRGLTMMLPSSLEIDFVTTRHLELFRSEGTELPEGSLLWSVAGHASSPFGLRLMKHWFNHLPIDPKVIRARAKAVEYFKEFSAVSRLPGELIVYLKHLPDLEQDLAAIFYKRCTVSAYLETAHRLVRMHKLLSSFLKRFIIERAPPLMILKMFENVIDKLSDCETSLLKNLSITRKTVDRNPTNVFADASKYPGVTSVLNRIAVTQSHLEHLSSEEIAHIFGRGKSSGYARHKGQDYVVAVPSKNFHLIPNDWLILCKKKRHKKYVRSPAMAKLVNRMTHLRRKLKYECHSVWMTHLDLFRNLYLDLRSAVKSVATLDCLMALGTSACADDLNCKPSIKCLKTTTSFLNVSSAHHTVMEKVCAARRDKTSNFTVTAMLKLDEINCLVVTGSHEPSKRFVILLLGFVVIMAQMGAFLRARNLEVQPLSSLTVRLGGCMADDVTCDKYCENVLLSNVRPDLMYKSLIIIDDHYFKCVLKKYRMPLSDFEKTPLSAKIAVLQVMPPSSCQEISLKKLSLSEFLN